MEAPKDGLERVVAFSSFETRDTNGDGLTLEGYGAVANQETVIDSWEGNFVERFAPGAWKRTLKNHKPVMQFDHGRDSRVGSTPIGAFEELRDDENGLYVRARLHDNEQVRPVRDAIASGAIDGMSVRMSVMRERWDEPDDEKSLPVRTILEARLFEVGPVVFPAYTTTSVGVRYAEQVRSMSAMQSAMDGMESSMGDMRKAMSQMEKGMDSMKSSEPGGTLGLAATSERSDEEQSDESVSTSDEPADTSSEPVDTSIEPVSTSEAVLSEPAQEHSEPQFTHAERPRMTDARRERGLASVREMVAAASEKDI